MLLLLKVLTFSFEDTIIDCLSIIYPINYFLTSWFHRIITLGLYIYTNLYIYCTAKIKKKIFYKILLAFLATIRRIPHAINVRLWFYCVDLHIQNAAKNCVWKRTSIPLYVFISSYLCVIIRNVRVCTCTCKYTTYIYVFRIGCSFYSL